MTHAVSELDAMITEFRRTLPKQCATAQAIDRQEPWQLIAFSAVADGYIEFANELGRLIEHCVRRNVC
jgi:hypothetical protein